MFRKWLTTTDQALAELSSSQREVNDDDDYHNLPTAMNSSPTFYERNLNVWRQLWRTSEISEILLVLIGKFRTFLNLVPIVIDVTVVIYRCSLPSSSLPTFTSSLPSHSQTSQTPSPRSNKVRSSPTMARRSLEDLVGRDRGRRSERRIDGEL